MVIEAELHGFHPGFVFCWGVASILSILKMFYFFDIADLHVFEILMHPV